MGIYQICFPPRVILQSKQVTTCVPLLIQSFWTFWDKKYYKTKYSQVAIYNALYLKKAAENESCT